MAAAAYKRRARTLTRGHRGSSGTEGEIVEMPLIERLGERVRKGLRGSLHVAAPRPLKIVEDDAHNACTIEEEIASVHTGERDYLLYAYSGTKIVKRRALGSGGLAALKSHLEDGNVNYGLVAYPAAALSKLVGRPVNQNVYVFLTWFPPDISPMVRGTVASHKNAIHAIFAPFHVEVLAESRDDIDDAKITKRVVDHVVGTY